MTITESAAGAAGFGDDRRTKTTQTKTTLINPLPRSARYDGESLPDASSTRSDVMRARV